MAKDLTIEEKKAQEAKVKKRDAKIKSGETVEETTKKSGKTFVQSIKDAAADFDFGDKKHKTHMTLVKDSLEESLDGPEDNFEPKPKKSPKPVEKLEDFYPNL